MYYTRIHDKNKQLGASLVEYCLLIACLSAVCVGSLQYIGYNSQAPFEEAVLTLDDPGGYIPGMLGAKERREKVKELPTQLPTPPKI